MKVKINKWLCPYKQYKYKIKDFYKGNCSYFEFISKL